MNAMAQLVDTDTLRIERLLPGPIERIWNYLTDSDKRAKWLATGAMELRPQGRLELVFDNSRLSDADDAAPAKYAEQGQALLIGRVLACRKPDLLSFLFGNADDAPEVTFELATLGDKVQMVLTQRRTPDRGMKVSMGSGWHAHLALLEAELAGVARPSFWSLQTRLEADYERLIPSA